MVLGLDGSCKGVQYLPGDLLLLLSDGPIVGQGLEGLSVVSLEHHFQLLQASLCGVIFFNIDVEGLQEMAVVYNTLQASDCCREEKLNL